MSGIFWKDVNSPYALALGRWGGEGGGKECGLTGGWLFSGPPTATVGTLSAFPLESTEASMNEVSDVGRELGGVGMYAGTGFRQPIPREFEGAIAVISRLILLNSGAEKGELG